MRVAVIRRKRSILKNVINQANIGREPTRPICAIYNDLKIVEIVGSKSDFGPCELVKDSGRRKIVAFVNDYSQEVRFKQKGSRATHIIMNDSNDDERRQYDVIVGRNEFHRVGKVGFIFKM